MSFESLLGVGQRLNVSVEAMAALAAELRRRVEGLSPAPEVSAVLERIMVALDVDPADLDAATEAQLQTLLGGARSFFRQAQDLMDNPDRAPGWVLDEPTMLHNQGRISMVVADLIERVAPGAPGLDERLRADGGTFLDVGTGVGLLAVAICRIFPGLRVTGIDPWPAAMDLAKQNVAESGLGDRIELRLQSAQDLPDRDAFDAGWIPGPFLPREIISAALDRTVDALRAGGWAIFGLYAAPPEPLAQALSDLRVIRSGGYPWTPVEAAELLTAAGFDDVRPIERTWNAPVGLVLGRKP